MPDVSVSRWEHAGLESGTAASGVGTLEPTTIPIVIEEPTRQTYIEILRRPDRELVAVLELLSPSNRTSPGYGEYLSKRAALLRQEVHLLELDLLLAGERMPLQRPLPPGDYYALLARADRRPDCEVYSWTVRHVLPALPIPLRAPDADILVDLAAVMQMVFKRGRYTRSLRYENPPTSIVASPQRDWIVSQVTEKQ